ncbi:hypothetical protein VR010_03310 [Actinomycetaceae bacterium L2_0104]
MDLNLQEWQALVAIVGGVLGAIAMLYTVFGSTDRRLRNDLASDTALLEKLRGKVRSDLRRTINHRAHLLVAATKYPSLTLYEVALALMFIPLFWWLFGAPEELRELSELGEKPIELSGMGQVFCTVIALVTYSAIVRSWSGRAAARIVYIYDRLGDDAARQQVRLLAFPAHIVPIAFGVALMALWAVNTFAIFEVYGWPVLVSVLVLTVFTLGLAAIIIHISHGERLAAYLRFYTDVLFIGADIPRLRPTELGQTAEDLARYEEEVRRRFPRRAKKSERDARSSRPPHGAP